MEKEKKSKPKENENNIWDCGSPLYDSYELASLGHVLERHTMAFPYLSRPIISNKSEGADQGRFEGKRANILGVGLFRKVAKWTIWKMRNIRRESNGKGKRLLRGFYGLCNKEGLFVQSKKLEN